MANITVTEVDLAIPEFWANLALGALKANTVMTQLVNRDFENVIATKGDVVNIIKRGTLSINDKLANRQIQLQAPTDSKIPVTLDKHKEVSWLVEDSASVKAIDQAIDYVQDAAIKIAEAMDEDLLALYSELANSVGTPGEDISIATVLSAREKLNILKCPYAGRVFVLSPKDETALLKLEQFTNQQWDDTNAVALREAILGRKYGFTFVMDQQVKTSGASPTSTHNMAFNKDAFALVTRPLPAPPAGTGAVSSVVEIDGISVRVTRSYSQKDGGMLWTLDVLYGCTGMRDDTHGVDVIC